MLSRFFTAACLVATAAIQAQTPTAVKVEVRTEAAQCDAIARVTACLRYTQPPFPETIGVKTPEFAIIHITGPETASIIQVNAISPGNRHWLRIRRPGALVGGSSITDQLPQDVEIYVDEPEALLMRAGRFVATLVVTVAGVDAPVKLPVQLAIGPDTDVISALPDVIPELVANSTQNPQPQRFSISVGRNGVGPPFQVSATPLTSDGGVWLSANLQSGFVPCATTNVPCEFEAIVTPPQATGEYWGALLISGGGYADRVSVRVKVNPPLGENQPTIEPRQLSFSAPLGSTTPVSGSVELKGGYADLAFRAIHTDPWLSVEPNATRWPAVLKLTANPTGLDAGLYSESVQLRSIDTNELLGTIPVTLTITAPLYLPTLLDGGGWRTTLYLVNAGSKDAKANLRFWSNGEPWLVGIQGRSLTTKIENEIIPPLGVRVIETQGAQSNRQQGWADLVADGPVSVHAVLSESRAVSGRPSPVDATLPLANAFRDRLLLPFDNLGDASASISVANPEDEAVTVDVAVLNENGAEITKEGKITLPPRGAASFELVLKWPSTAKRRGLLALEFDGRRLLAVGLRALGFGFHAYPAVARGERSAERGIARVTAGGPWQSTAYLANSSTIAQSGALRLWPGSDTGLSEESALPAPADGVLVWQAKPVSESRPDSGWLESRYPKQVGGFLLLRQTLTPRGTTQRYESALESMPGMNGRLAIPFDNRSSNSTQIVLVNTNDDPTEIQTAIYDLAGRFPRFGETFKLAGKGQLAVNSADRWELGGQQGVLVFSSRHSFRLTGVGLLSGDGPVTILPAFEK